MVFSQLQLNAFVERCTSVHVLALKGAATDLWHTMLLTQQYKRLTWSWLIQADPTQSLLQQGCLLN